MLRFKIVKLQEIWYCTSVDWRTEYVGKFTLRVYSRPQSLMLRIQIIISLRRDSGSNCITNGQKKGSAEENMGAPPDLTSWIPTISRLSLCEFTPDCLSNQWWLGTGETKLVAGEEKCLSGLIWYCSGCQGLKKLSEETQKFCRVGFHRVLQRGVKSDPNLPHIQITCYMLSGYRDKWLSLKVQGIWFVIILLWCSLFSNSVPIPIISRVSAPILIIQHIKIS